ncbi:hypothetical protein Hanom_Chr14g01307341 [Helianthus anomalus]
MSPGFGVTGWGSFPPCFRKLLGDLNLSYIDCKKQWRKKKRVIHESVTDLFHLFLKHLHDLAHHILKLMKNNEMHNHPTCIIHNSIHENNNFNQQKTIYLTKIQILFYHVHMMRIYLICNL